MRALLLLIALFVASANAADWSFKGFVRLIVAPSDLGTARIFEIPAARFYQTELGFRTELNADHKIELVFTDARERYLANDILLKPSFNLSDSLLGRHLLLQETDGGLSFYDDPDHILKETLPFDLNMLCLMLDLSLSITKQSDSTPQDDQQRTLIWSMPYVNQDQCRVLERLMATLGHDWGENQAFTVSINRDEVHKDQQIVITGTADGLGDGIITRKTDGSGTQINLSIHLDKSLLLQKPGLEGRLSLSEEHDFVLEVKQ
jgi:hypothetical protein